MFLMATDHFDKLAGRAPGDPVIANLYQFGKPFYDAFVKLYGKSVNDDATYRMHTQLTQELLVKLRSTLVRRWDVQIQTVFDNVTPEYRSLMPNGRKPFQVGAYDLRISHVKVLATGLERYPALDTLRAEVEAFHAQLLATRSKQQGVEFLGQVNSKEIENARVALAQAMHYIMGGLLQRFYLDLRKVETFYELKYLRKKMER